MSISGKFLSATYGGTPTTITGTHEWSVAENADRIEATTGADNGRGRKDVGAIDTRIKIRFYFDVTTGDLAFIRTGTVLSTLKLYARSAATSPIYQFTSATVFDTNIVGQVRDKFIVDVDLEAAGDVITQNDGN